MKLTRGWILFVVLFSEISSANNTVPSFTPPAPQFDTTKNAAWQGAVGTQMANIFSSCMNIQVPVQVAIAGAAQMLNQTSGANAANGTPLGNPMQPICPFQGGVTLETQCTGSDVVPSTGQLSCPIQPGYVNQLMMSLQTTMCTIECKKAKEQAVQAEIKCIMAQATALHSQMASLAPLWTQNIQRMAGDVQVLKSAQATRQTQLENITEKEKAIETEIKDTVAAVQKGKTALLDIQTKVQHAQQRVRVLDEMRQQMIIAKDMECFTKQKVPQYRCSKNGGPETPEDYLKCRFKQEQLANTTGQNPNIRIADTGQTGKAQAQAGTEGLEAALSLMESRSSTVTKFGTTADQKAAAADQPLLNLTIADIANHDGANLRQYKIGNTNSEEFVMSILASCDSRSTEQVNKESSRANSTLGQELYDIRQEQQATSTEVSNTLTELNSQYTDNTSVITQNHISLNVAGCSNAQGQKQVSCVSQAVGALEGTLNGEDPNSNVKLTIPGSSQSDQVTITCSGLNGCKTAELNAMRGLTTNIKQIETMKQTMVQKNNQAEQAAMKQIQTQVSGASQQLQNMINSTNAALASMGFGGISLPAGKTEKAKYDPDSKLIMPYDDFDAAVNSGVQPPVPNVSGGNLSGMLSSVSQAANSLNEKLSRVTSSIADVSNMEAKCQVQAVQGQLDVAVQASMAASNCQDHPYCRDKAVDLQNAVSNVVGRTSGMGTTSAASLYTGIQSACEDTRTGQMMAMAELKKSNGLDADTKQMLQTQYAMSLAQNVPKGCSAAFGATLAVDKNLQNMQIRTPVTPMSVPAF